MARIDSAILHEIARVVQTRSKVPDRVHIQKRQYQITYLEDHRQRMEDALRRHDSHVLNMLFGQLASKVKYQALRDSAAAKRDGARRPSPSAPAAKSKAATSTAPRSKTPKSKANTKSHKTVSAKRVAPKRNAAAKPAIKKSSKKAAVKPKKRSRR